MRTHRFRSWWTVVAAGVAAGFPVSAQAPELAMLETLNRGAWNFHSRTTGSDQTICVRTGRELIQIRHPQEGCSRFIIQDEPTTVTVQYTCRGYGYGRTTIRKEGNALVQIRSQGTQGGMPFSIEGEARRVGTC